jgi:hypothetical protein
MQRQQDATATSGQVVVRRFEHPTVVARPRVLGKNFGRHFADRRRPRPRRATKPVGPEPGT